MHKRWILSWAVSSACLLQYKASCGAREWTHSDIFTFFFFSVAGKNKTFLRSPGGTFSMLSVTVGAFSVQFWPTGRQLVLRSMWGGGVERNDSGFDCRWDMQTTGVQQAGAGYVGEGEEEWFLRGAELQSLGDSRNQKVEQDSMAWQIWANASFGDLSASICRETKKKKKTFSGQSHLNVQNDDLTCGGI